MRVLVTGSEGKIGSVVARTLRAAGMEDVAFDLARGADVRDVARVRAAARGCDAAVHLAAIPGDGLVAPDELMHTNLLGTWHVLLAAQEVGMRRVVFFSSVNALGVFLGQRRPDYLPLDDDHPSYACRPYALSKRLGEEMCRAFTADSGISTVCLRPPWVVSPDEYAEIGARWQRAPESEWAPYWEYGAFLDVRDAAEAARRALVCPDPGHVTLLLCGEDVASSAPSRHLVERLLPDVQWRGGPEYERDPYRALLDTRRARAVLGWRPRHRWRQG